jgi:putative membrane protein
VKRKTTCKIVCIKKGEKMTKFILRWMINVVAIYLVILIVPGIHLQSGWVSVLWLALILGLINAFVRPLLKLLTCPLIFLTLGLFTLLINTFLLWLTSQIGQAFGINMVIDGFWPAFLGGLVVTAVSVVMSLILRDELKGRKN